MTQSDLVRFCRYLRANGFSAGVTESLASVDAIRVMESVDPEAVQVGAAGGAVFLEGRVGLL